MEVRIKATLDFLFNPTIIAIFSNLCAYFYRQIQLFLGLLYYIDTFIPKYLSARVCPEADLGGGSRGSGPPPFIPNMYETIGFMLCVTVTQYRVALYI